MVSLIELLADVHGPCLQEMEARLARWESNARHNIGDFLYNTLLNVLPLYDQYLENLIAVLEKMEYYTRTSRRFDQLCRDFEAQKHCYLPLTSFLLKPLQRLLHYNSIIDSTSMGFPSMGPSNDEPSSRPAVNPLYSFRIIRSLSEGSHGLRGLPGSEGSARRNVARRSWHNHSSGK